MSLRLKKKTNITALSTTTTTETTTETTALALSSAPVSIVGGSFWSVSIKTFMGGYLWYGAIPVTISIAVMPNDQMSALKS